MQLGAVLDGLTADKLLTSLSVKRGKLLNEYTLRRVRKECTSCPEWSIRCVHTEEYVIWLVDFHIWKEKKVDDHGDIHTRRGASRYAVADGPRVTYCIRGREAVLAHFAAYPDTYFDNLDAAQEAFTLREEIMYRNLAESSPIVV